MSLTGLSRSVSSVHLCTLGKPRHSTPDTAQVRLCVSVVPLCFKMHSVNFPGLLCLFVVLPNLAKMFVVIYIDVIISIK